ncbi:hypothetical protein D5086_029623 [Populus alba]|uniref:Uncharacterized protein n=1 Tax=Populus alba TaxID=43335 RepID=A0ACC4AVB7_POPAL
MEMASSARTVEEIFKDFSARRAAVVRALTCDVDAFYGLCDPDKENLCLYGHPSETWEVALPAEEVPPELPEPALGINFARDGMNRKDWLSLVAVHSDSWLLSVAFYLGARLNRNERKRLFSLINDLPTVFEVVTERKPVKEKPSVDSGSKSRGSIKRSSDGQMKSNPKLMEDSYEDEEDDHTETLCGSCGGNYNADEFWIGCDVCERWYHGKCVKITPAKADSIKQYKCPSWRCGSYGCPHLMYGCEPETSLWKCGRLTCSAIGPMTRATPKGILKAMGIPGLTIYHVKSHLQKYRILKFIPETNRGKFERRNISEMLPNFSATSGAQLNEALLMQMEVHRRLSDQLVVQKSLKLKIEAQERFLERIVEENQNGNPKHTKSFSPVSLPSLCDSESNAKEFETDSEVRKLKYSLKKTFKLLRD